jgi:protein phosphatase
MTMSIFAALRRWFTARSTSTGPRRDAARSLRETNGRPHRIGEAPAWDIRTGYATDPGCVRATNEDALLLRQPSHPVAQARHGVLAVVCDGMGGHEAGEVASALALETIVAELTRDDGDMPEALVGAIESANRAVHQAGRSDAGRQGMGTTCCALLLRDGAAYCAHVGDSRCYLRRGDNLLRMTEDHSAVMELVRRGVLSLEDARHHPDKNVISRALGSQASVEVTSWTHPLALQTDDTFLLCSDGLYDLVDDEEILHTMTEGSPHPQVACDRLVALARSRGGFDNVSVIILQLGSPDAPPAPLAATRAVRIVP